MTIDISKVKYPDLERALNLYPGTQILLGEEVYWTEKRDGSNIGCYFDENNEVQFRSRNMDKASEQFYNYLKLTDEYPKVIELLRDAGEWQSEYVIFGELLTKGKSPTKIETHDKHEFVVFDIWYSKKEGEGRFMNYTLVHQHCSHFGLPVVELYGTSNSKTLEHFFEFKDKMLTKALENKREGVVGKVWRANDSVYFKEKNDTPKFERIPRSEEEGCIKLPELPLSEVTGAIEKARVDLGDDFTNAKKAMPIIIDYINQEAKKHVCRSPKNIFALYQDRLKELI